MQCCPSVQEVYLTHSINANISFVVGARGAIFDLAGHGEEEVKVLGNAVQLTDVFICTQKIQIYTTTMVSVKTVASFNNVNLWGDATKFEQCSKVLL